MGSWQGIEDEVIGWWSGTTPAMHLFAVGGGAVLLSMVLVVIGAPDRAAVGLITAGTLVLAAGFLLECYTAALRWWETTLGKLGGALLATIVASFSMGLSSVIINEATGIDPSHLSYAVAFLAPLTAGYVVTAGTVAVVAGFSVWFVLYSLWGFLVTLFGGKAYAKRFDTDKVIIRMVGVLALVMTNAIAADLGGPPYRNMLSWTARGFTFSLEMYGRDPCARGDERVRRLSDDVVVVGRQTANGLVFERRQCPLAGQNDAISPNVEGSPAGSSSQAR